ncbi:hypothetical protein WCP94_000814 (plasmid) [Bilophila wadsworthia]
MILPQKTQEVRGGPPLGEYILLTPCCTSGAQIRWPPPASFGGFCGEDSPEQSLPFSFI